MVATVDRDQSGPCGGGDCRGCASSNRVGAGTVAGGKLVACAISVFLLPLIAAAIGAGLADHYTGSASWTILAAAGGAVVGIVIARLVTIWIGPSSSRHSQTRQPVDVAEGYHQ